MQKADILRLVLLLVVAGASQYSVWRWCPDPFVSFYTAVFVFVFLAKAFEWPNPTWFAEHRLNNVRERTGTITLRGIAAGTPVADLRERRGVKQYFASVVYNENTRTLCNEISQSLVPKVVVYGAAVLFYWYLAKRTKPGAAHDEIETVLKGGAAVVISLLPLFWDFARCELQKYFNKELREPEES